MPKYRISIEVNGTEQEATQVAERVSAFGDGNYELSLINERRQQEWQEAVQAGNTLLGYEQWCDEHPN